MLVPKVVLISPRVGACRLGHQSTDAAREPLGVLAVGSYLKHHGYQVQILDANLYSDDYVRTEVERLVAAKPVFVGLSVMTAQLPHALEISKLVKHLDSTVIVVWGGIHPTLFPAQTSLDPHVDLIVHGPGEATSLELAKKLQDGEVDSNMKGIAHKGKAAPTREREDLDTLPFFDYGLVDLKWYLGPAPHYLLSEQPIRALNVLSSRGCPWRCGFCINYVTKNRWRALSAERFLDEIEYQVKTHALEAVRIMDEDFFVSKKRVTGIIEGMHSRNLHLIWGTNVRANYFNDEYITAEYARSLADVGVKFLSLGAESGSDRVLQMLHKDITTEQILRSARVCAEAGIIPVYSWMIGIPGQTKSEMRTNIDLMNEINAVCPSALHTTNWIFRPFPGGDLYETCKQMGLQEPSSVEEWAQLGVDQEQNTGFYSAAKLPWIEDVGFVEFVSEFTPSIRSTTGPRQSVRGFALSVIVRFLHKIWDWPIVGWLAQKTGSWLRMTFVKMTSGKAN
ncbi:MAG: hypothetical protein A2Y66_02375 [Nitrospirae bacterium RBG_13_41_22]|nr:MAG: hypothetical protein A2Y66_02375 [Nitrospirae bacterium RBG_13_41_22]